MNRQITYEVTDELFLQSLRHSAGAKNYLKLLSVYLVWASVAVLIGAALGGVAGRVVVWVVIALGVLASSSYWFAYYRSRATILATLAKLPHRQQSITFTDECVLVEDPLGHVQKTWDMLRSAERFSDVWHLQFLNSRYVVPAELMDQELASFVESKAKEQRIPVSNPDGSVPVGTAEQPEHRPGVRRPFILPWWGLPVLASMILIAVWCITSADPQPPPLEERFVVSPGHPKVVPVPIGVGDSLDLSVVVASGAPVDLRAGRQPKVDNTSVTFQDAGLFVVNQTRDFRQKDTWPHPGPAIIIITSKARSEGVLKAVVSRSRSGVTQPP